MNFAKDLRVARWSVSHPVRLRRYAKLCIKGST